MTGNLNDKPFSRLTLRFASPRLEREFTAWVHGPRNLQMRLAMLLVACLYAILGILDLSFSPETVAVRAQMLHFLVIIPTLLLSVLVGSFKATVRFFIPAAVVTTAIAALSHLHLVNLLGLHSLYVPELFFMILWVFTVAGFRLWPATLLVLGIIAAAVVNAYMIPSTEQSERYAYIFWLFVSFSLAFLGGYLLEYSAKVNFYNATLLHDEIEERKVVQEQLKHAASHDPLTGLPNRALLSDRLENAIAQADRTKGKVGWIYVDLDNFKRLNDTFGHAAGDQLLTIIAQRLKACVRETDTVGRLGGDEFTVLLTGIASANDAMQIAEKIRATIEMPYDLDAVPLFKTSASIGVALYPDHGRDETALSKSADAAMYGSKAKGRDAVTLFQP